jgi:hypothetical protein
MGMADPYPFVLSDAVTGKLAFIHQWIRDAATGRSGPMASTNMNSGPGALQTQMVK